MAGLTWCVGWSNMGREGGDVMAGGVIAATGLSWGCVFLATRRTCCSQDSMVCGMANVITSMALHPTMLSCER